MIRSEDLSLLVDFYELAMAQAYRSEGMTETAVFSLFFRDLPPHRNFVLACGQQHVAEVIRDLRFSASQVARLASLNRFQPEFLDWLRTFRFSGHIHAVAEGTPLFPHEPLMEVEAPIAEAQLIESLVMNYVHLESVLASKAVRVRHAAAGRPVVDFGMRRMHGVDAAYRGVRAYRLAGLTGTSNVLAGLDFGVPVQGTMAHSFVQAYPDELDAFKTYARLYPGTTLLVDTYDTRRAVHRIVAWLQANPDVNIGAIRLDSGDLAAEARDCRAILDAAGFTGIRIMASGGLDEYRIARMLADGVPVDAFGVGTALGAAVDAPALELAYKLTEYAGQPRMKNSPGKQIWPGRKQVFRQRGSDGRYRGDIIAGREEVFEGDPLLRPVMKYGVIMEDALTDLDTQVKRAQVRIDDLPGYLKTLATSEPFPVVITDYLKTLQRETLARVHH